jgi:predicted nucleotide-binding protein
MARINQQLLERLQSKLGVTRSRIYSRIDEVARELTLDRHLAALVFAQRANVNIHRYSTEAERAEIRSSLGGKTHNHIRVPEVSSSGQAKLNKTKKAKKAKPKKDDSVFVVHGRNEPLRKSFFEFLRSLGLKPMEWSAALMTAKGANPYIGDVLDSAMEKVSAVVVLFSPDDEARLKADLCSKEERTTEGKLLGQPRPNVIFEAGLALGRHPEKTLLVQIGKVRGFTDIAGKHVARLSNDIPKRNDVAMRLKKIGCEVDTSGSDWTSAGDFIA